MRLDVSTGSVTDAATTLLSGNQHAATAYGRLVDRLGGCGGMAGDDSWAGAWASAYDESARQAVVTFVELVGALGTLVRLTEATGENHRRAERASITVGPGLYVGGEDEVASGGQLPVDVPAAALPSSLGGDSGDLPGWWSYIADKLEGLVWPDARCDVLRDAGSAWRDASAALDGVLLYVGDAASLLEGQRSPEIPVALATLDQVRAAADTLRASCLDLADACEAHADEVEEYRQSIIDMAEQFLAETIAIQTVTHGLAFFTVGVSEIPGQLLQGARAAALAGKIRVRLAALSAAVVIRLAPLERVAVRLADDVPGLRRIRGARPLSRNPSIEGAAQAVERGFVPIGGKNFLSPAGLVYGMWRSEHRLRHVLLHAYSTAKGNKKAHSVFREGEDVLALVDEAWLRRGSPVPGDPCAYLVDMGRVIGTKNETLVKIVLTHAGTDRIRTAYPFKLKEVVDAL